MQSRQSPQNALHRAPLIYPQELHLHVAFAADHCDGVSEEKFAKNRKKEFKLIAIIQNSSKLIK